MIRDEAYSPFHVNRRRTERLPVSLPARIARGDGETFLAETICLSIDGAAFASRADVYPGELVGCLIGSIGLVRATVARFVEEGFAVAFEPAGRDQRAATIAWLEDNIEGRRRDLRGHERHLPPPARATFVVETGERADVAVADLSFGGARIVTELAPPLGTRVRLGAMPGRVVRHTEDGLALLFTGP